MSASSYDSNDSTPKMFQPLRLRGLELKNRVIKAATHDGIGFDEMTRSFVRLARNDVSLITVAYVAVSPINKTFDNQHHIGPDNADEWRALCSSVHKVGGKMSAQLHHPGLFCMSSKGRPMGPSFFWLPSKLAWPKSMSKQDLADVRDEFIAAAALCIDVGFDCIELHCGHGYLLSQFLSPIVNRRSDEYGGSPEARARFPAEIAERIRAVVGDEFPLVVKMNADDGFPVPGGLKLEGALTAARIFAAAGVDAIIPSYGYTSLNGFGMLRGNVPLDKMVEALPAGSKGVARWFGPYIVPTIEYESLFLRETTQQFVAALSGTPARVIYIGGADSYQAIETVLADGCAAVQLGRPLIREPFFVRKLMVGARRGSDTADVTSKCVRCNICTLASIDPVRFKPGCPFLKPTEGRDIEDLDLIPRL